LAVLLLMLVGCADTRPDLSVMEEIIDSARREWAPDQRTAVFDVSVVNDNGVLRVVGEVDGDGVRDALLGRLAETGREDFVDELTVLPAADLAVQSPGVVRNSVGNLRKEPQHTAELVSQVLMGMELRLLKREGSWILVQGPDRYLGWIERSSLLPAGVDQQAWKATAGRLIYLGETGRVRSGPDVESEPISDLVMDCVLGGTVASSAWTEVVLPDGSRGFVESARVVDLEEWTRTTRPTAQGLESTARSFIGVPYLWGGTSAKGFDCSGFTQLVFRMNGVPLQRDSSQQAHQGEPVDSGPDFAGLRPGDLLFFGRRESDETSERVTHVGIYNGTTTQRPSANR
jgi:gamma-D-glutamyl-L-lysine dipeptidyl-peptidase